MLHTETADCEQKKAYSNTRTCNGHCYTQSRSHEGIVMQLHYHNRNWTSAIRFESQAVRCQSMYKGLTCTMCDKTKSVHRSKVRSECASGGCLPYNLCQESELILKASTDCNQTVSITNLRASLAKSTHKKNNINKNKSKCTHIFSITSIHCAGFSWHV